MRIFLRPSVCALAICAGIAAWPVPAQAQIGEQDSALALYYSVKPDPTPGLYDYNFKLVLDNHTGSWSSLTNQGYGGLVFGDVANANSPLADFALTGSRSIGVWSALTQTGDDGLGDSYHNGPTLAPVFNNKFNPIIWYPTGIGDSLSWSGTSSSDVSELTFSTLFTTGGAVGANFQPAAMAPEPSSLILGLTAVVALLGPVVVVSRRRRRNGAALVCEPQA
jgi:hypothetical protein